MPKGGRRPGAGRPTDDPKRPVQAFLDDQTVVKAQNLGHGNISAGVRAALTVASLWSDHQQPDPTGPKHRVLVHLDADTHQLARAIGGGNVSLGIRSAINRIPVPE